MDYINILPHFRQGHDSVWVIISRLTKSTHFIHVSTSRATDNPARLYIREIVYLHGVPTLIVSDRDQYFVARLRGFYRQPWGLPYTTTQHIIQKWTDRLRGSTKY